MSLSPNVGDLRLILDSTRWTPHCGTVSGTWIPQEKIFWIPLHGAKCFARRNILRLDLPAISTAVSASNENTACGTRVRNG